MKNLFERLKPEAAKKLQDAVNTYPVSLGTVVDDLKKCKLVVELKYLTVVDLYLYGCAKDCHIKTISDLFID